MKILSSLLIMLTLTLAAFGQQSTTEPELCSVVKNTKQMYRSASPQVKANTWLAHLLTVRSDGKRTPEQTASIDETLPFLTADVFDNGKKTVPAEITARSLEAFKDEKWLLSQPGPDAAMYLAKNIPLLTMQTVSAVDHCYCRVDWGCNQGYKKIYSECWSGGGTLCITTSEGCGWLWLQACNGYCV